MFMTIKSKTVVVMAGPLCINAELETFISKRSCGIINGKPNMAIIAAFCCAFAAIAARKVNTRLRPQPPKKTMPIKFIILATGLPRNKKNRTRLSKLIINMSRELKRSLDKIKF
jgi:hypothetical protein